MSIRVSDSSPSTSDVDWLLVLIASDDRTTDNRNITEIDRACDNAITSVRETDEFDASHAALLPLYQIKGVAARNLLLVGAGTLADSSIRELRQALLAGLRSICRKQDQKVSVVIDERLTQAISAEELAECVADCAVSAPTDADVYKATKARHPLSDVILHLPNATAAAEAAIERGIAIGEAGNIVKQLVNRTADDLYPESFAARAEELASENGLAIQVLDEDQLRDERMGAMLAVAKGSTRAPRMVKLTYQGATADAPTLALVGKGVTFDSGGYSIKPSDSMVSMKADMAGAATVLGAIIAAARLKLKLNVVAYLGLVENMISGNAYRLGDVLTARNGTTIEVHNTDAEGRLVLADVLAYAVDDGADRIIDLATLTGACVVALGEEVTGVFSNDTLLTEQIKAAAERAGEFVWPMPMHKHFEPLLKSSVADCKNVGPRWGGAVTAAKFLQKFVGETNWAHMDIAGPSWADSSAAWQDCGGTAASLRTLVQLMR